MIEVFFWGGEGPRSASKHQGIKDSCQSEIIPAGVLQRYMPLRVGMLSYETGALVMNWPTTCAYGVCGLLDHNLTLWPCPSSFTYKTVAI